MRRFLPQALPVCTLLASAWIAGCSAPDLVNLLTPATSYSLVEAEPYGPHPRHKLDVHVPRGADSPRAVVVFFYGGSWRRGDRLDYRFLGHALAARGHVVVIPDYRLYPEVRFPSFVEDGAAALRWVHDHIEIYSGDPDRVHLMGHSAGAHIAALLALDERYLAAVDLEPAWLAGMIGLAGPYDFLPLEETRLIDTFGPEILHYESQPVNYAHPESPPFLLIHGKQDERVPPQNTMALARAIQAAGGHAETLFYRNHGHHRILAATSNLLRFLGSTLHDVHQFIRDQNQTGSGESE